MLQIEVYALFGLIWPGNRVIGMQNKESKLPVREAGKGKMHVHV